MLLELVPEPVRFRVSSIDPSEVDLRLARKLIEEQRLCRYLHLPLQSGSESVLERMKRVYTAQAYEELVTSIGALDPGFGFGADVIVGFPGETEAEFEATRALLERLPVSFYHVFPYSDRENTAAARMRDKVPRAVAMERGAVLRRLGDQKRADFLARHVGTTAPGIVESTRDGLSEVMLEDYATVWVDDVSALGRRTIEVRIEAIDDEGRLRGRRVDSNEDSERHSQESPAA